MSIATRVRQCFVFVAVGSMSLLYAPGPVFAGSPAAKPKIFAQKLVEEALAKHPGVDEVGISVRSPHGCRTIASTDKGDLGEACETDDLEPIRTGKPYVEKERDGYDVSVPLRDTVGRIVGSLGVGFKVSAGETKGTAIEQAAKISKEMAGEIPSKLQLFARQR
jgi:hypothetical protein